MLRSFRVLISFIVVFATPVLAQSPLRGSRDDAIAMVKRVQVMFAAQGTAATFAAINDLSNPEFHDRDLYPFVYDLEGVNVAHGARPVLVGKNLSSLKDQDGKYLIQEIISVATGPGSGWVDYKWPHPITNKIEDKSSYIEKLGAYVVGVRIPIQVGRVFRFEAGHHSGMKPATIPIKDRPLLKA